MLTNSLQHHQPTTHCHTSEYCLYLKPNQASPAKQHTCGLPQGHLVGQVEKLGDSPGLLLLQLLEELVIFGIGPKLYLQVLVPNLKARSGLHLPLEAGTLEIPRGSGPALTSLGSHFLAHSLALEVIQVTFEDGGVLLDISVLQEGLKVNPSMLRTHKNQGRKLSQGKAALPLAIVKILLKKVLLTLEILDEGLPKMKEAALDYFIEGGLKGSELSLLKVYYDKLQPK
ncbi:hypothetical protein DSO57_1024465 [Entomophthora muscae]|uniref:Uncharacterized protein n=1 Tax=Entomophthora muscae TaxID=34485 RepID=A0ACC2RTQ2_9FUNG|nr:hypothetical protein DSO57_1024465 [Entomophthora muscae]